MPRLVVAGQFQAQRFAVVAQFRGRTGSNLNPKIATQPFLKLGGESFRIVFAKPDDQYSRELPGQVRHAAFQPIGAIALQFPR